MTMRKNLTTDSCSECLKTLIYVLKASDDEFSKEVCVHIRYDTEYSGAHDQLTNKRQ